jgi:hypothetical protein
MWEPRADWPSGELAWFEVARLLRMLHAQRKQLAVMLDVLIDRTLDGRQGFPQRFP